MRRDSIAGWTLLTGLWWWAFAACSSTPDREALLEGPVEWGIEASADKNEVQVGEDLTLTLTIRHPPDGEIVPPASSEFGEFTVVDTNEVRVGPVETQLLYRLAAYRLPTDLEIPSLVVRYRDQDGELAELGTDSIPVRLVSSLTPDVTTIHDIKEPTALSVPRDVSLFLWLLAALLLALVAYIIYRTFRRDRESLKERVFVPPPPPPELEARDALRRLEAKKLIERDAILAFYAELSEIMKRYAGRRFGVPYLEQTTDEILRDLRGSKAEPEALRGLRGILESADLAKFAKWGFAADDALRTLDMAKGFLERTWPPPAASGGIDESGKTDGEGKLEATV